MSTVRVIAAPDRNRASTLASTLRASYRGYCSASLKRYSAGTLVSISNDSVRDVSARKLMGVRIIEDGISQPPQRLATAAEMPLAWLTWRSVGACVAIS